MTDEQKEQPKKPSIIGFVNLLGLPDSYIQTAKPISKGNSRAGVGSLKKEKKKNG